jgi:F0F1-type ATP synthase epsilon subunit
MRSARRRAVAEGVLQLTVRTPQGVVFEARVTSLRVPSDTGQVGLRPRAEAAALVVEPGLVLARAAGGLRFVATAGGLLRCDGERAILLTPLAVVGASAQAVRAELEAALAAPGADLELRGVLERLETGILRELRRGGAGAGAGGRRAGAS